MKCLNPECGSLAADEINISVNVSETAESEEVEYLGYTDHGDTSNMIGTVCRECDSSTYLDNWQGVVKEFITAGEDSTILEMRQDFHDNYGTDNVAALHAAYDLICYLEQRGVI